MKTLTKKQKEILERQSNPPLCFLNYDYKEKYEQAQERAVDLRVKNKELVFYAEDLIEQINQFPNIVGSINMSKLETALRGNRHE